MARKGHVISEMARKGHVISEMARKGRTTAAGRRQHRQHRHGQHRQCMATRARHHQQHYIVGNCLSETQIRKRSEIAFQTNTIRLYLHQQIRAFTNKLVCLKRKSEKGPKSRFRQTSTVFVWNVLRFRQTMVCLKRKLSETLPYGKVLSGAKIELFKLPLKLGNCIL